MAANLLPISSDGGFTSGGNINSSGDPSAAPSLNDFFSITSAANFAIVTDNANTDQTWTFDDAGNLTLPGNTFAVNYANGAQVSIGGSGNTGNVTFDDVTIQGVNQLNLSAGADFTANLAYLQVRSGDVASHIHLDTGNNEAYDLIVGDDAKFVQVSSTGNIIMSSYDGNTSYTWTLDTTGNLILAGGESVIQSVANSSLDPLNPNVSTMILTPSVGYSSQSLVLDPTAPGHIHLRAPSANIDEPLANIFLGGEDSSFEVGYYNGAAPNLFVHSGGNTWTFDTTGILAFPRDAAGNTDPILTITGGANPKILSEDVSLAGPANLEITALNTIFTGSSGSAIKIYPDDGEVASDGNLQIWANSGGNTEYSWTFDTTGNLTTPSNLVIGPGPGSGSSIFQYDEGLQILGEGANSVVQLGWTANTSAPDSVTTIAMNYPGGGEGNILIAVGNNATTVNYWLFDNTGNLTLPDTTSVLANVSITLEANDTGNITGLNVIGDSHANLYAHGNVTIVSDSSNTTPTWTFGTDGNLTIPGSSGGFIKTVANASIGIAAVDNGTNNPAQLLSMTNAGAATSIVSAYATNATIQTNATGAINTWQFDNAGNLTLPGNTFAVNYANGTQVPVGVTQDITSNGAMSIMLYDGNIKYNNYATVEPSTGNIAGGNISANGAVTANTANITTGNITTINSGLLQNGNSNITLTANGNVSIQAAGSNVELVVTSTGANVTGTLTSTGKIGYASGSTVTQATNRGTGVTINAIAGTIITTSAAMVATEIDTFSVTNSSVDPNNDIVLAQIVSPNQGTYNCIANPAVIGGFNPGFFLNIVNISGFTTSDETITIRFMVIKAPNA